MCGINALFDPHGKVQDKHAPIARMNSSMWYRGPDGEGSYIDTHVGLGSRRLSIIDVAGSAQPIYNEDRSLVLILNGEIYNFKELRKELIGKAHCFQTNGDAEVILHLYEDYGVGCLNKLRGMFAFVLWDLRHRRLFAARDRVGIKPLYYFDAGGVLYLSSEAKSLIPILAQSPTIDPTALWQFFHYGYPVDQQRTCLAEIQRLKPGEYLLAEGDSIIRRRYWTPPFGVPGERLSDQRVLQTLEETVNLHLRSDVPVGILLSSGLDSATIAAVAAAHENYMAFCVGDGSGDAGDEREGARHTARLLGLPTLHEIVFTNGDFSEAFDELTAVCDEPIADPSAALQWLLYRAGRSKNCKVMLSGIGSDEVFFGYETWNAIGSQWRSSGGNGAFGPVMDSSWNYRQSRTLLGKLARPELAWGEKLADQSHLEEQQGLAAGPDALYAILFNSYLVHNGLLLGDKLSMGCSIELRVPFADHQLIESVLGLPLDRRFSGTETKTLLRRLVQDKLPGEIRRRPKQGFAVAPKRLADLVVANADEICGGVLADRWFDRDALAMLVQGLRNASPQRLVRAMQRRLYKAALALDWDPMMWRFSGLTTTEFLYRLLVFERWMGCISRSP